MSWLWREKPDGTRGPGYLLYLALALAALALIEVVHRRLDAGSVGPPAHVRSRGANVGAITSAAARMSPVPADVAPSAPATRSYRLAKKTKRKKAKPTEPATGEFDPIQAALARAATAPNPSEEAGFAALPSAFAPEPADGAAGSPPAAERPALLGYRDPSADVGESGPALASSAIGDRLPRATMIPVFLLTSVDTGNPAAVLQFGVADDVVHHGRCRLPMGTRFLGRLSGAPVRDRLNLVADTLLYPDGVQLPVKASAVEAAEDGSDIRPGVSAQYFPPPTWVQMTPYAADFFTGFMGILQARAQQRYTVGVGSLSIQTATPDDLRGPADQASAQAVEDFARERLKDLAQRYAPYHLIPAGTAFWLQLLEDLDLSSMSVRDSVHGASIP